MLVRFVLIVLYLAIPFGPIAIVMFSDLPSALAGRSWRDDLASAMAMVGLAILFLEFVVIGRYRGLSRRFGCDFIMRVHQLFARTATVLVVAHPFLYSLWGTMGSAAAKAPSAKVLGLTAGSLLTGALAWMLVLALVFSAIRRHHPGTDYDRWRFWHAVLAVLVVGFGLHHTLYAGLYASLPLVKAFWWILAATAAFSVLLIYVVRPFIQKQHPYRCDAVHERADRTWELVLSAVDKPVSRTRPGQFFWIKRGSPWTKQDHPFSVASYDESAGTIRFLIKIAGDFTKEIPNTKSGEIFYLDGPNGDFQVPSDAQQIVLVAGGIGLAPFLSILAELAQKKDPRPIILVQATGQPASQVDIRAVISLENLPRLSYIPMVETPTADWLGLVGRCDGERLKQILIDQGWSPIAPGLVVMICGPNAMIDSIEKEMVNAGLPIRQILSERYQYDLNLESPVTRRNNALWLLVSAMISALILAAAGRM